MGAAACRRVGDPGVAAVAVKPHRSLGYFLDIILYSTLDNDREFDIMRAG